MALNPVADSTINADVQDLFTKRNAYNAAFNAYTSAQAALFAAQTTLDQAATALTNSANKLAADVGTFIPTP